MLHSQRSSVVWGCDKLLILTEGERFFSHIGWINKVSERRCCENPLKAHGVVAWEGSVPPDGSIPVTAYLGQHGFSLSFDTNMFPSLLLECFPLCEID